MQTVFSFSLVVLAAAITKTNTELAEPLQRLHKLRERTEARQMKRFVNSNQSEILLLRNACQEIERVSFVIAVRRVKVLTGVGGAAEKVVT